MNYKIIMLATAAFSFTQADVNAQTSNKKDCATKTVIVTQSGKEDSKLTATYELPENKSGKKEAEAPCEITYVRYETSSHKNNPRLKADYDMPGDVYEGKEVLSNDGVAKNRERNINYLDFSVRRVPNDGGLYMKQ